MEVLRNTYGQVLDGVCVRTQWQLIQLALNALEDNVHGGNAYIGLLQPGGNSMTFVGATSKSKMQGRSLHRGEGISFECMRRQRAIAALRYHARTEELVHTWGEDYDAGDDDAARLELEGDADASPKQRWVRHQLPLLVCPLSSNRRQAPSTESETSSSSASASAIGVLICDSFNSSFRSGGIRSSSSNSGAPSSGTNHHHHHHHHDHHHDNNNNSVQTQQTVAFVTAVAALLGSVLDFQRKLAHSTAIESLLLVEGLQPSVNALWSKSLEGLLLTL